MAAVHPHLYLVRLSGELSIKAKATRSRFTRRLALNVEDALRSSGIPFRLERSWSRLYVHAATPDAFGVLRRVFGVSSVSPVERRSWSSLDDVVAHGEEVFAELVEGKTFAVRARRGERKLIPFNSLDIERELGTRLLPRAAGVDLREPQIAVHVELQRDQAYYFAEREEAEAGLPLGVEGKAVALISGGFDSAVAAWQILRRGVRLDYVFCNLGGTPHRDGALAVIKVLADRWSYGYRPKLHMIDFQPLVEEIEAHCDTHLWQVVLKRHMLRAAERVAEQCGALAIVTGEAVGQVSSQTLQNLAVISAVARRPILRPLIGVNKTEIVAQARHIGSFDASAKVPEYCALVPTQPATHAHFDQVEVAEIDLDLERLGRLVDERAVLDLRALDLSKLAAPGREVEDVPAGATVIDLRSKAAFDGWHYPGALWLSYFEALKFYPRFDRDKLYLFYCEVGLKSAHLAEVMHEQGFRAVHFKGGLKPLRRLFESRNDPALAAASSPVLLASRDDRD